MSDLFTEPDDATPLTAEERRDLIPAHIAFRAELNEAELENIARGQDWALARRRDVLTEKFIKDEDLRQLLEDAKTWVEFGTHPPDEIAVRFHHRLVRIHPFPNGNGRHSRLMADLLIMRLGGERFTWGSASIQQPGEARRLYIDGLKEADNHDLAALLTFGRS